MWAWFLALAMGGYGDAVDGRPNHAEREVHFWTNLVRIDPAYFTSEYPCSFNSFTATEKTSKAPLLWDHGLGEAARVHSADMDARNYFSHDTLGGPSFSTRVWSYYDGGAIGENIAYGYGDAYTAVISGWMCSSGHRANIMSSTYDELGTGVAGTYYTQDFGGGNPPLRALAMGVHLPKNPGNEVDLAVDWTLDVAPQALYVVLNGERYDLDLFIGDPGGWSGWTVRLPTPAGCSEYYFVGEAGGITQTFPQDGSYTFGNCNPDDAEAGWVGRQLEWEEEEPDDEPKTGSPSDDPADDDPADDGSTGSVPFDPWYDETEEGEEGEDTDMVLLPPAKGCSTSAGRGDTVSWTKWSWEMLRRR